MGVNLTTEFYSPLRYPGGKGKLAFYIQLLAEYNLLTDGHYIEPYAGGSSVALSLLINEFVSEIHINDIDYNIYCFWHSIINETDKFCELILSTEINIKNWQEQKIIQSNHQKYTSLQIGFSTFFLNRTNRSGILKAGVIGGNNQIGNWKIDARFKKEELIARIRRISNYKDRINLYNIDAIKLINKLKKRLPEKSLYYLDPPYYKKGKELYINFYEHQDHLNIAKIIDSLKSKYWLLSYDNHKIINKLYSKYRHQIYDLNYSAGNASIGSEILVFSDKLILPKIENPLNKKEIKRYSNSGLSKKNGIWESAKL
jgi:DNA adenine methylase